MHQLQPLRRKRRHWHARVDDELNVTFEFFAQDSEIPFHHHVLRAIVFVVELEAPLADAGLVDREPDALIDVPFRLAELDCRQEWNSGIGDGCEVLGGSEGEIELGRKPTEGQDIRVLTKTLRDRGLRLKRQGPRERRL